jgi:hypothetical protein
MINIRIYIFLLGGTLLLFLLLRIQGKPLMDFSLSPFGIVSLEMAKSEHSTKEIISGWKEMNLLGTAKRNVVWDFLFIPFYSMLFYTLCGSISVRLTGTVSKLGILLAFSSLVAGLLDLLENFCLLLSLHSYYSSTISIITFVFASLKFFLLTLAILYVLLFGAKLVLGKLR